MVENGTRAVQMCGQFIHCAQIIRAAEAAPPSSAVKKKDTFAPPQFVLSSQPTTTNRTPSPKTNKLQITQSPCLLPANLFINQPKLAAVSVVTTFCQICHSKRFEASQRIKARRINMVVSGPPQSPRTGLALTDLQQSTSASIDTSNSGNGSGSSGSCSGSIGGGVISGLAIAGHGGSSNWSTRGVGGIGAGLSCSSLSSVGGGLFGVKMGGGMDSLHSGGSPSLGQGSFGGFPSSSNGTNGGLFNNCGCSSSDYGLFKK
uniref:Uncharacterized protein n=1 Tax=Globodera rostochiensis TaxID=31243 RepID=A0A914I5L4_GLORO